MDLGCLDLGCISVEKQSTEKNVLDSQNKDGHATDPISASSSKSSKNKSLRESQSTLNALNKFTPQIKKPPHRKSSPLNWFPRKKVDSYLKRKIKMLQEVGGMNSTLDETLGDSNPHYSRVLREKIAAREAAHKAMEARRAALVETSWCRILRAARIQSKEAEALLLKAEKTAAEAIDAATAMGVIMYDKPNCPQKTCQVETSSVNGGGSTTHTVTASFETAFEVDKKVAAAVKTAFIRLANCSSFNKDEFKDLLRKISQNPDTGDNNHELSELSSECESESGSELDTMSHSQDLDFKVPVVEMRQRKYKRRQSLEKWTMEKLVDMMVERLRCLHEDELSSLATIVATCGLNAALARVENSKLHDPGSAADYPYAPALKRMSSFGSGTMRKPNLQYFQDGQIRRKQPESELPSLDKFLVKHMTKLEREVQEAKNSRRNDSKKGTVDISEKIDEGKANSESNITSSETLPDLGSILVKHSSRFEREIAEAKKNSGSNFETERKSSVADISSSEAIPDLGSVLIKHSSRLEKEIEETKRKCGKSFEMNSMKMGRFPSRVVSHTKEDVPEVPSLDKFLVKHVSRLEKEVQEARNSRKKDSVDGLMVTNNLKKKVDSSTLDSQFDRNESFSSNGGLLVGKENIDLNKQIDRNSEMEKKECAMNLPPPNTIGFTGGETLSLKDTKAGTEEVEDSLDKILVKPVHWLEREKMQALSLGSNYGNHRPQKKLGNNVTGCESLDKVLVKHVSRLEKEKMRFTASEEVVKVMISDTNMHSQMNEEGSLDQILVKHKSRLEREKMAAAQQPGDQIRLSVSRREARERELKEAWGGLSLGNSIRPSFSKLERDKAAWIKAEEEERRQAMREV